MFKKLSISKSRYLSGLQCSKLLWHQYNAKHLIPPTDALTQAAFDRGHDIGNLAKKLYPEGIEVEWSLSYVEIIARSKMLLNQRKPLFEAGFFANGTYARVDVLNPAGESKWDIVEVKSGTEVQEVNLHDLAFQRYCYEGAGLQIRKCFIMHVDSGQLKLHGETNPEAVFVAEDVTERLARYAEGIEERLKEMFSTIRSRESPEPGAGPHCNAPYRCPMIDLCSGCGN